MDLAKAISSGGRTMNSAHTSQTVSTNIISLKNKCAAIKRRITNTLKKVDSTIGQCGWKATICGFVNDLQEYLIKVKELYDELVSVIPENKH